MSQEKVNKKKEYKSNRKVILKKEKRKKVLGRVVSWLIVLCFIGGIGAAIGTSVYNNYKAKLAALPDYKSTEYMLSDMAGILETDASDAAVNATVTTDASAAVTESTAAVAESTVAAAETTAAIVTGTTAATATVAQ